MGSIGTIYVLASAVIVLRIVSCLSCSLGDSKGDEAAHHGARSAYTLTGGLEGETHEGGEISSLGESYSGASLDMVAIMGWQPMAISRSGEGGHHLYESSLCEISGGWC